jgi:hypothetical protein
LTAARRSAKHAGGGMRMDGIRARRLAVALLAACSIAGCGGGDIDVGGSPQTPTDFEAQASDFDCILDWTEVRHFRITNKVGLLDEALAVANDPQPGRQYPVGTIIQLFPGEAMVKRGPDYDPANNNWEYFELRASEAGTEINVRGRDDVINMFGGQCFGCHVAARDFDFICEEGHGCIDLPIGPDVIRALQQGDPRCRE